MGSVLSLGGEGRTRRISPKPDWKRARWKAKASSSVAQFPAIELTSLKHDVCPNPSAGAK